MRSILTMSIPLSFSNEFSVNFNNSLEDKLFVFALYDPIKCKFCFSYLREEIDNNLFLKNPDWFVFMKYSSTFMCLSFSQDMELLNV